MQLVRAGAGAVTPPPTHPSPLAPLLPTALHPQEALHLQVATLAVMHRHGLSRRQVADLARDCPTFLRGLALE